MFNVCTIHQVDTKLAVKQAKTGHIALGMPTRTATKASLPIEGTLLLLPFRLEQIRANATNARTCQKIIIKGIIKVNINLLIIIKDIIKANINLPRKTCKKMPLFCLVSSSLFAGFFFFFFGRNLPLQYLPPFESCQRQQRIQPDQEFAPFLYPTDCADPACRRLIRPAYG